MQHTQTTSSGSSPAFILFLIFLVLKLTGTIDWSWWWVTAPLWISAAIFGVIVVVGLTVVGILHWMER